MNAECSSHTRRVKLLVWKGHRKHDEQAVIYLAQQGATTDVSRNNPRNACLCRPTRHIYVQHNCFTC